MGVGGKDLFFKTFPFLNVISGVCLGMIFE